MLKHNKGHIVNINSMLGLLGFAGAIAYSASKHGALGLSESLLLEIRHSGNNNVNFTNIHPFHIDTSMFAGCASRYVICMSCNMHTSDINLKIIQEVNFSSDFNSVTPKI